MSHARNVAIRTRATADGRGRVFLDYRVNGERVREVVGPATQAVKRLARELADKRIVQLASGELLAQREVERVTLAEFAVEYLEIHASKKRSYGRIKAILDHLKETFGDRLLVTITSLDVERYQTRRSKQVSAASVNRELAILKNLFNKAIAWGKAERNPVKGVSFLTENNQRVRFLTPDEGKRLERACDPKLLPVIVVARHTGMRQSELVFLRKSDVDLRTGFIRVREAKNGTGRDVPLSKTARQAVERSMAESQGEFVFERLPGVMLSRRWVYDAFQRACKAAGVRDFRFHDLRHDCASQLVMKGESLYTVASILGHKTLAMTKRYAHLSPGHLQTAVEKLDEPAGPDGRGSSEPTRATQLDSPAGAEG